MAYDYLTPTNKKFQTQPAEIETPNTQGTELQQTVQANNQMMQPNIQNNTSHNATQPTKPTQPTQPTVSNQSTMNQPKLGEDANNKVATVRAGDISNLPTTQGQYTQPSGASIPVKRSLDLDDNTVQGYLNDYEYGVSINDYQAQINALNAIDNYRATKGLKPIYRTNVYELTNQRTAKIENAIKDYENDIASAMNLGDYEAAQIIGQQLEDYKKMVNYKSTVDNAANFLERVEYTSRWDNTINEIVGQLLTAQFTYDPSNDEALLKAQQYATNVAYESMNAKGILDSTMTTQMVTKTVNELIPIYQKMAKQEFNENIERLQTMANFIIKLDDRDYSRWEDEVTRQLKVYEAKRNEIDYQWNRTNQLGYVDNEASIILGVAPGTLSPNKRQAIADAQAKIEEENRKLQSDIILAQAKAELDLQSYAQKKALDYQYDSSLAGYKASLKNVSSGGSYSGGSTGNKLQGTAENIKKTISDNYDGTNFNQTLESIYTNFSKNADRTQAIKDILNMTEQEAIEKYNNSYANQQIDLLEQDYGTLTKDNREYFENEINLAYKEGALSSEEYVELNNKIKDRLEFNEIYDTYEKALQNKISTIDNIESKYRSKMKDDESGWITGLFTGKSDYKDYANSDLKEAVENWNRIDINELPANMADKYGESNYSRLINLINTKEDTITSKLKNKGIDWR